MTFLDILRVILSACVIWSVNTTVTRPRTPSSKNERVGPAGVAVHVLPVLFKTVFWTVGLSEILVVLHTSFTSILPETVMKHLTISKSNFEGGSNLNLPLIMAAISSILGGFIRQRCYQAMGDMFTFELSILKNHRLVTHGPYAFVRHPSYTGAALSLCGAVAWHIFPGSYFMELCAAPWLVRYAVLACWIISFCIAVVEIRKRLYQEDGMLRQEFGSQWDEWASRVPYKLIPSVY